MKMCVAWHTAWGSWEGSLDTITALGLQVRWREIAQEIQALLSARFLCPEEQFPMSRPDNGPRWPSQASLHVSWHPGTTLGMGRPGSGCSC